MIYDIIIIALFLISIFLGYKKGFAKIVLKFLGFILAIGLAYIFSNSLAEYIYNNTTIGEKLNTSIEEKINGYIKNEKEELKQDNYYESIEALLSSDDKQGIEVGATDIVSNATEKISMYIIKGAAFLLIVIIVNICVLLITFIFEGILNLPILKTFNKTGGIIISLLLSLTRVWIILGIISILSSLGITNNIIQEINNSIITKWLYNNNVFMNIIISSLKK